MKKLMIVLMMVVAISTASFAGGGRPCTDSSQGSGTESE